MEFVLGAAVFMIGVLVGAALSMAKTSKPEETKIRPFGHDN